MMRVVFINYSHTETRHVSSMRQAYFARVLAHRGHQVVLLTPTLGQEAGTKLEQLQENLRLHDWREPFHLACAPVSRYSLDAIRNSKTPRRWRQLLILYSYVLGDGLFADWTAGSKAYWKILSDNFRPQIVSGTFGSYDCCKIAQGIARCAGARWVMDIKDDWGAFIPAGLRRLLARRIADADAMTFNSRFLFDRSKRWFHGRVGEVVYSGADSCWFADDLRAGSDGCFRIAMMGSIYGQAKLESFFSGLGQWLSALGDADRKRIVFSYAGREVAQVAAAASVLAGKCKVDLHEYLDQEELSALCRNASVNIYMWHPATFHHKLIELLCARRPIITFPGEYEEALSIAKQVDGRVERCANPNELVACLSRIFAHAAEPCGQLDKLRGFSWERQADTLESLFMGILKDVYAAPD